MHRASMIDWQLESPKEVVGFFPVQKANVRQRLFVDCRRSNGHFVDPPKTKLPTAASSGRVTLSADAHLFSACYYLKDAFQQFELYGIIRPYFCFDSAPAHTIGLRHLPAAPLFGRGFEF